MIRRAFDGFSAVVPDGWSALLDDATYSDPGGQLPTRFFPPGGGELIVSLPPLDADDQPGADADELEALAREWGMRRGVDEPLAVSTEIRQGMARATASYRIGEELVEVWFASDGTAMIKATYVCPWSERDRDRPAREALIGSLRFR
jgi:hypothetical protein